MRADHEFTGMDAGKRSHAKAGSPRRGTGRALGNKHGCFRARAHLEGRLRRLVYDVPIMHKSEVSFVSRWAATISISQVAS